VDTETVEPHSVRIVRAATWLLGCPKKAYLPTGSLAMAVAVSYTHLRAHETLS
jgi:hypothetical protein